MPSDECYATQTQHKHCVKSVRIWSFSGPYVPAPENVIFHAVRVRLLALSRGELSAINFRIMSVSVK